MGQCNVEISAHRSGVAPRVGEHSDTQISRSPRGLELIKSCAKFYANQRFNFRTQRAWH